MEREARDYFGFLGEGAYSVSETCRILQPTMTPRKVHYWLDTGLLGEPLRRGRPGRATLLNFEQLLRVRMVQHLRDEVQVSLPRVRESFEELLTHMFGPHRVLIKFTRSPRGHIAVRAGDDHFEIPVEQRILPGVLPELGHYAQKTRAAWEAKAFSVEGFRHVVTNARVLSGAPIIKDTRLETSAVAALVDRDLGIVDAPTLRNILQIHRRLSAPAVTDALRFEGLAVAA